MRLGEPSSRFCWPIPDPFYTPASPSRRLLSLASLPGRYSSLRASLSSATCRAPLRSRSCNSSPPGRPGLGGRKSSQVKSSRVQSSPVESSRVQSSPVESSRVKSSPVESSRVQSSQVESSSGQGRARRPLRPSPVHLQSESPGRAGHPLPRRRHRPRAGLEPVSSRPRAGLEPISTAHGGRIGGELRRRCTQRPEKKFQTQMHASLPTEMICFPSGAHLA